MGGGGGFESFEGLGGNPPDPDAAPPQDDNIDVTKLKPAGSEERFKITENVNLKFILNNEEKIIDSINISVGGKSSKSAIKLGYNIKCNQGNIYGRKNLRLRSNMDDASFLRSKLSSDILNRVGVPSISANYARLFVNNDYMGLYVLVDAYKKVFPEDKEVSTLYQCSSAHSDFTTNNILLCANANDDYKDEKKALENFITTINAAQTRKDVENIMDVDEFMKVWIFEWLVGTWDSSLLDGKNYYIYQQINGKWVILPYDFDSTFGFRVASYKKSDKPEEIPFEEWYKPRYIVDVLTKNDTTTFITNLQYMLDNAFNPDLLFPHIDSLRTWLTPYVEEDRTPINGTYPGFVNVNDRNKNNIPISLEDFYNNSEYTEIKAGPGLKKWIQGRYDYVCSNYPVTCNSSSSTTTTTSEQESPTTTIDIEETKTPQNNDDTCWSEALGYPCCTSSCLVILKEDSQLWGAENGDWCGIKSECQTNYDKCWSSYYGYPCCSHCKTLLTDESGSWGAENGDWCGIVENKCQE
ncbi:coth-domain-containing protein [Anaeromyces robustus]|uniref:Coth-domain-containing protein n=1 Tax=Anaeromyces robustus TaxID=1754192 RepID=A0A1Y1WWN3_9FUNG|nr:coth-domain-containing protein [Anaeromyces robustus]|eukprot:ORX77940.1 coth-domain-containing protein [Anaeromyces robustus]